MSSLLEKVRRLSRTFQGLGSTTELTPLVQALSEAMETSVALVTRNGDILADANYAVTNREPVKARRQHVAAANASSRTARGPVLVVEEASPTEIPVQSAGEFLATLVVGRPETDLSEEDWVLAEYGVTVMALAIVQAREVAQSEEVRHQMAVKIALEALSYSELAAVQQLLRELNGEQGLLITSQVADRMGITRSVIVNALRKLESAGVLETRSLGMKGTHIRVLNERLRPALAKLRV